MTWPWCLPRLCSIQVCCGGDLKGSPVFHDTGFKNPGILDSTGFEGTGFEGMVIDGESPGLWSMIHRREY